MRLAAWPTHVEYLGRPDGNGGLAPLTRCEDWKQAINRSPYDYLLVGTDHFPVPPLAKARELT